MLCRLLGLDSNGGFGSSAELNDTPKAAVRAAGIEGIADLAIRQNRPFASDKFWKETSELEWQVLAVGGPLSEADDVVQNFVMDDQKAAGAMIAYSTVTDFARFLG